MLSHRRLASLRLRLFLLVLLVLLPCIALAVFRGLETRRELGAHTRADLLLRARQVSAEQEHLIEWAHQLLTVLARLPEVRERNTTACSALLADLLDQHPYYTNLLAVGVDGFPYCSGLPGANGISVADRDYFHRTLASQEFTVSEYLIGRFSSKPNLTLAYPILDSAGQTQGMVLAGLNLDWLSRRAASTHLPADSTLLVVDRHGSVLVREPEPAAWVGRSLPDTPLVRQMLAEGEGVAEVEGIDGRARLFGFAPLGRRGAQGAASVAIGVPADTAFAEADRALQRTLVVLAAVGLLGLGVAGAVAHLFVLGPVRVLTETAQRLQAGDLSARTGLAPARTGDLGQLGWAFDQMAATLERREAEQQHAAAALRESETRFRALADDAPVLLWIEGPDGNRTFFNRSWLAFTGRSLEQELGPGWTAGVHPEDLPNYLETARRARERAERFELEYRLRRADGEYRWVLTVGTPRLQPAEGGVGFIGTCLDVTQHRLAVQGLRRVNRRLEETLDTLRQTQRQVIEQERLRALGEMASGIAHDFNNALSQIIGFTELLLVRADSLEDPARVRADLELIMTAAADAAGVVRRLREFYRPRDADEVAGQVDLPHIVARAISLTQFRWKDQAQARGVSINVATDLQPVPPVLGCETDLREALTNLIFNAVDALPQGGTIIVRTRADGSQALLEVADTGVGMTDEVRQRCLEPFFSTKGEHGTGLGLAMVFGIVRRHEGTIEIDSTPGQGTTVRLRLPLDGDPNGYLDRTVGLAPTARPLRVLLVDDDPRVRRVMAEYLQFDGHTVTAASDGWEGLERFQAGQFDLVLTDRAMPGLSGDEFARRLKAAAPGQLVLMLTGFGELMDAASEHPAEVDAILAKPVRLDQLRRAIAGLVPRVDGSIGRITS